MVKDFTIIFITDEETFELFSLLFSGRYWLKFSIAFFKDPVIQNVHTSLPLLHENTFFLDLETSSNFSLLVVTKLNPAFRGKLWLGVTI